MTEFGECLMRGFENGMRRDYEIYDGDEKMLVVMPVPGAGSGGATVSAKGRTITVEKDYVKVNHERLWAVMSKCESLPYDNKSVCITMPEDFDHSTIKANVELGVLYIEVEKIEKPTRVEVE